MCVICLSFSRPSPPALCPSFTCPLPVLCPSFACPLPALCRPFVAQHGRGLANRWPRPDEALVTFATPALARQAVSNRHNRSSVLLVEALSEAREEKRRGYRRGQFSFRSLLRLQSRFHSISNYISVSTITLVQSIVKGLDLRPGTFFRVWEWTGYV